MHTCSSATMSQAVIHAAYVMPSAHSQSLTTFQLLRLISWSQAQDPCNQHGNPMCRPVKRRRMMRDVLIMKQRAKGHLLLQVLQYCCTQCTCCRWLFTFHMLLTAGGDRHSNKACCAVLT